MAKKKVTKKETKKKVEKKKKQETVLQYENFLEEMYIILGLLEKDYAKLNKGMIGVPGRRIRKRFKEIVALCKEERKRLLEMDK